MNKTAGIFRRIFKHTPVIQFISCVIFLMYGLSTHAQTTYPVQVFTQLTPPYTPYLPAYYSGVNQKLKVTLINTDMKQPLLNIYLRMSVKSSAFTIETPENVYTQRLELQAGVPLQLSLNDLADYFKNQNMRISGGRNEFLRTNMLPDNFYRFNFEVYEANTGRLLSNPKLGFAQAMIASGEPPVLNLPLKGSAIMESNIPSVMFSWTPRHMNSVASAYGTEYEFTLVEIYDKQISPEAAFGFSRVLYTETVRSTSFIHTAAQPQLIPGMRYAWRVRAVAREGVEEANIFKNNGFSPVSWFDYTVDCKPVRFDRVEVKDRVAIISWQQSDAVGYDVQYRKKGSNKWYTGALKDNETCPVYNLKFGQAYEYRIGVRCTMNDAFTYSEPKGFSMPEELAKSANCGILPNINVSNRTPARELQAKLPILVGDFPVFITKVSGSGRFTGEGYVGIPYMKNAKIAVTFRDIVVNTDNRLISGFFETKYDISSGKNLLLDVDETLTGGKGVGDIRTGEEKARYTVDYTISSSLTKVPVKKDTSEDKIKEGEAAETTSGENERYIVTLTDDKGNKQEQVVDKFPATIEDASGATYEVDKEGNIKQVSSKSDIRLDDNTKYRQDTTIVAVRFEKTENTRYALDVYTDTYNKVTEYEREYAVSETEPVRASAKLMLPDTSDEIFVRAIPNDKEFDPAKVHFITENRTEYKAGYDSQKGGWTLNLVAPPANDGLLVYVVYDKGKGQYSTLAILKVLTYEPEEVNVMLVPVNRHDKPIDAAGIQDEVNAIYNKFGVTVNLKVSNKKFDYTPINGTFQIDGTGLFDTRTADMDALEAAFKKETGLYNDQTVYLFVMDKPSNVPDAKGDMPRDSRMGYLFPSYDARTIAHEIGHGVFNLKHPFAKGILTNQFNKGELKDNLMDYPVGTGLAKLQWDALHAPGIVIGLFEKDGDAMIIQNAYYWTPSGEVMYLEKSDTGVTNTIYTQTGFPNGALYGFNYKGNTYEAHIEDGYFKGYAYITSPNGSTKEYHYYDADKTDAFLSEEGDSVAVISRVYIGNCTTIEYRNKIEKDKLKAWKRTEEGSKVEINEYFTGGEKINTLRISDCGDESETGDSFFSPGSLSEVPYLKSMESSFEDLSDEITYAANKVNELMGKNPSSVYSNGYYRIHVDDGISVDETFLKHFDDKVKYLSDYSDSKGKQVDIYVVFQKFEKTIMANNWNGYARKVYEKSNLNVRDAILITVPYFDSEFTTYKKDPWPYTERLGFAMPGMYNKAMVSTSDIKKRSREGEGKTYTNSLHTITYYNITLAQSLDFIKDVYIQTAKPVKIHYGFLFPNGSTSVQRVETNSYISGTDFSNAIVLLKNNGLDEIAELPKPSPYNYTTHNTSAGAISQATINPDYIKELLEYNRKYDEICSKATIEDQSQWTQVENEILFKEKHMDDYAKSYVEKYAFKSSLGQYKLDVYNTLGITSEFKWDNDHTYNKDNLTILDPIIYGVVDGASFVAGFWGLDFIPDGIGLAYAVGRKQPFEITSYSAGIMLVGISGGYIRILGKYGDDAVDYVRFGNKFYVKGAGGKLEEVLEDQITSRLLRDYLNMPNVSGSDINKLETLIEEGRVSEIHLNTLINDTDVPKKADLIASLLKGENLANNTIAKNTLKEALEPATYRSLIDDFGEESMDLLRFVDNGKVNDELIESWKILKPNKPDLCKDINVIEVFAKVRKNPNLTKHGITDEMLSKIQGFSPPPVSYVEVLEDLEKALDILPADKTKNFVEVISNGNRGLVNNSSVGVYDRRHSWFTLKKIQENELFFKNADEITFEMELEVIDGIQQAVPDIVITKDRIKYIGEIFAGQTAVKSNLSTQTIRYMNEVTSLENLRFFCHKTQDKITIIEAWKKGGVLDNKVVFNLFKKYDEQALMYIDNVDDFEGYLRNNDEWFNLIFNSNF